MRLPFAVAFSILATLANAWTVTLPYQSVTPVENFSNSSGVALAKPLLAYYSIPYASPPTGNLRYAFPVPPKVNGTTITNTNYGPVCPQASTVALQSEDCLTLSVFKPQSAQSDKLPVVIWVPGGAFNTGGGSGLNLPSFVGNAPEGQDVIGVSINYRIGALGFLGGSVAEDAGLLNLGLADQAYAFEWVQKYISLFGGDPDKVTLFGESAGAHSVGTHLQHTDPGYKVPFQQAIMDSGGPTARAWATATYDLYQDQTNQFLNTTGCNRAADSFDTYSCLRALPLETIRNASISLYNKYSPSYTWPFQPVVDGKFVKRSPTATWDTGAFNKIPVLTGFNSDEGTGFAPAKLNTTAEVRSWLSTLLPLANSTVLDTILQLYPDPVTDPSSPYNTTFPGYGVQFTRIAAAVGDYAYIAAVRKSALSLSQYQQGGSNVWKYHFNKRVPAFPAAFGVAHTSELPYVTKTIPGSTADLMNGYYLSFIITGDPNALKSSSAPYWDAYQPTQERQLIFNEDGSANMEWDNFRYEQNQYWISIPEVYPH